MIRAKGGSDGRRDRLLDESWIDFDVVEHAHTERATDEAAALGLAPEQVAKTIVLITSSGNVRAVLAASERIRFAEGRRRAGRRRQEGAPG